MLLRIVETIYSILTNKMFFFQTLSATSKHVTFFAIRSTIGHFCDTCSIIMIS